MTTKRELKTMLNQVIKQGEYLIYPVYGVVKFLDIVTEEILGAKVEMARFITKFDEIEFSIPLNQVSKFGIRPLLSKEQIERSLDLIPKMTITTTTNLSKKLNECQAQILSGNFMSILQAAVNTHAATSSVSKSYSETRMHEKAISHARQEITIVCKCDEREANRRLVEQLSKRYTYKKSATVKTEEGDFDDEDLIESTAKVA